MVGLNSARWLRAEEARVADLHALLQTVTTVADCPFASAVTQGVPVYDCDALRATLGCDSAQRAALMAEWAWVWEEGPGILVLKGAVASTSLVDAVTGRFSRSSSESAAAVPAAITLRRRARTTGSGTHWKSCASWIRSCSRSITPTT